jgi:hypothetical protein
MHFDILHRSKCTAGIVMNFLKMQCKMGRLRLDGRMDWSDVTSIEGWKGLAKEALWRLHPLTTGETDPLSWPISREQLAPLKILWPRTYQWPFAVFWVQSLQEGMRRFVEMENAALEQSYPGVVIIQALVNGESHDVAIDYSDYIPVNDECARRCVLYFKMQYSREGYSHRNVVPGGFVPYSSKLYKFLPYVRAIADRKQHQFEVYGRFGSAFATETRALATSLLSKQDRFHYEGGMRKLRYSRSLAEIAKSEVCIDLPGNGDFCFRLVDYLAVGACIIGPRHQTDLPSPLRNGQQMVFCRADLSDLIDLCTYYLEHEAERAAIANNARLYFDRYLHQRQLSAYYLQTILKAITPE